MRWSRGLVCACALPLMACTTTQQAAAPKGPEAANPPSAPSLTGELSGLLPRSSDHRWLAPSGEPKQAAGEEELYALINGGAGVFIENGYRRVVVQEYRLEDGSEYVVELYDMGVNITGLLGSL